MPVVVRMPVVTGYNDTVNNVREGIDLPPLYVPPLKLEFRSKVKTLYNAKLDPELMAQVKEKYPHLLEEPKPEEEKTDDVQEE